MPKQERDGGHCPKHRGMQRAEAFESNVPFYFIIPTQFHETTSLLSVSNSSHCATNPNAPLSVATGLRGKFGFAQRLRDE